MRTAVDVHNFLVERDIPHELVSLRGRARSPEQLAGAYGLEPGQVARVVLHEGPAGLVAALVPSHRDPDPDRLAEAADGVELAELPPERATDRTDFLHESMPPVGLPPDTAVVIDRDLADQEVLYFPAGEPTSVLKIRAGDLIRATAARVASITR